MPPGVGVEAATVERWRFTVSPPLQRISSSSSRQVVNEAVILFTVLKQILTNPGGSQLPILDKSGSIILFVFFITARISHQSILLLPSKKPGRMVTLADVTEHKTVHFESIMISISFGWIFLVILCLDGAASSDAPAASSLLSIVFSRQKP